MENKSVVEQVKRTKILIRSADFLWQFDQPIARTYFAEAFKIADDRFLETGFGANSVSKAQILLGLANMYERVNHSVALDELGEAIHFTNSLKDPDIFATSVQRQIAGDGFGFYASFHTPGYNLETAFEELSKKDFEMSLANAKALDDKYFRTLAVIAVANSCAKNSKPAAKPKVNDRP